MKVSHSLLIPLILSGCNASTSTVETAAECASRFAAFDRDLDPMMSKSFKGHNVSATYTFDATASPLAEIHKLGGGKADIVSSTGAADPAVAEFMKRNVDENGALLIAEGKTLYRIRLSSINEQVTEHGCAMQKHGMRLFQIDRTLEENSDA